MMKERKTGLDIVKALATLFVVCAHFYLSCGYYQTPIASTKMYVMTFVRWGFMVAVPLFLMSTGYFKDSKTVSKAHYFSLLPIIITYFILCTFRMLVENTVYGKIHTFESGVKSLLSYTSAWYVGMYVGLMLICPFLNKLWNACNEKEHKILIASLVVVTMMYPLTGYVFPSYFQYLYPITYYYIGIFIKVYSPKINKFLLIFAYIGATFVNGLITSVSSKGGPYAPGILASVDNGQNAVTIAIASVSIFLLFYDVNIKGKILSTLFKSASNCSLEIYLLQAAYNAIIYTYMGRTVAGAENYFWYFFVTVPASFVLSWVTAAAYKALYNCVSKLIGRK